MLRKTVGNRSKISRATFENQSGKILEILSLSIGPARPNPLYELTHRRANYFLDAPLPKWNPVAPSELIRCLPSEGRDEMLILLPDVKL